MSRPTKAEHEFFVSVMPNGKKEVAMHCTETDTTQYYQTAGTPKFNRCCGVEETFIPVKRNWLQRTFAEPELETRLFLLPPNSRNSVQWIPEQDCTAIYEPTMEGPAA